MGMVLMVCLIARPNPQALFDQYKDTFAANVLGGSPVVPESNEWYVVALNYAMAEEFYAISEQQWRENDPRHACCDNLLKLAAKDGLFPRAANFAQGYAIITGAGGTPLPRRIEIVASNDRRYATTATIPAAMPEGGSLVIRVRDNQPGIEGNAAGTITSASLATGITGIDSAVQICGSSFSGGSAPEGCEAFRARYIARKQYQPRATQAWAIDQLMSWPGVTRVVPRAGNCCNCDDECEGCGCKDCGGSLDFYVLFDTSFPCGVAPQNVLSEIQTWMFGENNGFGQGQVEIGVCGSIVRPIPFEVDVYLDIVGCPTVSQITTIKEQVADFFTTLAPSTDQRARQIELIVANIVGSNVDVSARFQLVTPDTARGVVNSCNDLLVTCDSLPCLRELIFTGPNNLASSC